MMGMKELIHAHQKNMYLCIKNVLLVLLYYLFFMSSSAKSNGAEGSTEK